MSLDLLHELRALGVVLSIDADGRLAYDAPVGVINDDLLARVRADRDGLMALVELFEERAAICEHDGGLCREDAERLAWHEMVKRDHSLDYLVPMPGVICPWCRSGEHLLEHLDGLRCDRCGSEAFRFDGDVIVRCDWVDDALV